MLVHLLIKNYALIEQLELTPDPHLNIITGETGAGKSILLGAIGLLMGNRADTKVLYNPSQKCIIEGTYDVAGYVIEHVFEEEQLDYAPTCLIRREIAANGKSRAFVNDTPVNLETLRRITSQLMDVHSQHDTLLLGTNEYQLQIVDTFAQNDDILKKYRADFQTYQKHQQHYEQLKKQASQWRKEFDYNQFLYDELEKARLQANEQEQLEQELVILENATEVRERLQMAHEYLNNAEQSALDLLKNAVANLNSIGKFAPAYEQLRERAQSSLIELRDLAEEINYEQENVEIDDEQAEHVRQRLALIYQLQQKHQVKKIADLLIIQDALEQKVSSVLNLDETIATARAAREKALEKLNKSAVALSNTRQKVLPAIEQSVVRYVTDLGIPNATLTIQHQHIAPTTDGTDSVSVLFSANKGIKPQPLKNVASGGEFSRLMMAIKYILANKRRLPIIVFDEIDTGVSGEIAIKMGNMMRDMAQNHQVISITHLHQIAAQGTAHYFVYKDNTADKTVSRIKKLSFEERVMELAQMIGGKKPSEVIVQNARELLQQQMTQTADKVQAKLF
ncbi:MAG: DNA repair protein RecN [Cytophagia bacterium]|nr:MAG: DNA repair protein RecN [Runella sp.]TAG20424.1 MAG: DNA repair protein RecN [Cytophagales bacterium]TAG39621.1 MAG: DNA repair protein RecN [Cytophagia bacterium]TAG81199.1 MAG: DNA repair protein RecN [Cytophagales bacterium]